jgi:hypothetical protein
LSGCWVDNGLGLNAIKVRLKVTMNPNRTVQSAVEAGYGTGTVYQAALEEAIRALNNPACQPLTALPEGQYQSWKSFVITFGRDG